MQTFDKIYNLVRKIPKGKVTTYGAIAQHISTSPKIVGFALHANKNPSDVPCHRVINSKGKVSSGYAFGGPNIQETLLKKEGIVFKNDAVDLNKFGFFLF